MTVHLSPPVSAGVHLFSGAFTPPVSSGGSAGGNFSAGAALMGSNREPSVAPASNVAADRAADVLAAAGSLLPLVSSAADIAAGARGGGPGGSEMKRLSTGV